MAKWKVDKAFSVNIPGVDDACGFKEFSHSQDPTETWTA
jgi:hypothetical protein